MAQTARFQDILLRLRVIDERFVEEEAGIYLDSSEEWTLDEKSAALVTVGAMVAVGSPAVGLEWSVGRALAAGATKDQVVDVLLAVAPVAGLSRIVAAVPDVSIALGYDVDAALEEP